MYSVMDTLAAMQLLPLELRGLLQRSFADKPPGVGSARSRLACRIICQHAEPRIWAAALEWCKAPVDSVDLAGLGDPNCGSLTKIRISAALRHGSLAPPEPEQLGEHDWGLSWLESAAKQSDQGYTPARPVVGFLVQGMQVLFGLSEPSAYWAGRSLALWLSANNRWPAERLEHPQAAINYDAVARFVPLGRQAIAEQANWLMHRMSQERLEALLGEIHSAAQRDAA